MTSSPRPSHSATIQNSTLRRPGAASLARFGWQRIFSCAYLIKRRPLLIRFSKYAVAIELNLEKPHIAQDNALIVGYGDESAAFCELTPSVLHFRPGIAWTGLGCKLGERSRLCPMRRIAVAK